MVKHQVMKILILLISLCLLVIPMACKKKEAKKTEERAVNVRVQAAENKPLRPFIETIGTLHPYDEVIVSAEVDGILKDVRVYEGTAVSRDMILATIDDTDYILEVKRAEAALRQTEATLANTKLEYQRKEALYKEALVTKQQFDDVFTRLALAEAEIERAKATLSLDREKLRKTKIYSPLAGYVKEKKVSAGDYVKNGTNLFVIIQNNPIKLKFTVTERYVGKPMKGQDVTFRVDAFPGKEFKGKVSTIYASLEEKTRALTVEALVPNPVGFLKPGIFAHVMLYTGETRGTIVVPITSLLYEEERVKIFVVEGDRAKERHVKLGSKYGEVMEIVEGLQEGEMVVVVGQQSLAENTKVKIQPVVGSQQSASEGRKVD